ncbi:hypothetical protein TW83_09955 [Paracoccus sp. S4493]|uniref:hypothetical protein n=1 Tax=Paracoccus sp. S4493 TaxID=579490 RepID=UPI0005F9DC9A|nr:hypothetical protein [Paracoccus sp. S4493]KJZ31236.1 hypothetical protein TW83_09955 [Paracoccus sp. S4493]
MLIKSNVMIMGLDAKGRPVTRRAGDVFDHPQERAQRLIESGAATFAGKAGASAPAAEDAPRQVRKTRKAEPVQAVEPVESAFELGEDFLIED